MNNRLKKALQLKELQLTGELNKKEDVNIEENKSNENNKVHILDIILNNSCKETVQTSIRLKKNTVESLDKLAQTTNRSRSYIINCLIDRYCQEIQ